MYRVKFLQVSTGQILGLLPLYQLDYRNHHHQLINVHESVTNIFLPIIIFIAIIFRHIWASSTLHPSSPSASIWSQQPTQQVSNIILPVGKASHFCPRPSSFRPRSAVIPISCCFREWHWTTLEWRWRSERKERKWGRGWLWLVSASFDTVWPSFVRAVVGSTSFLSLYGTIHFVIPYSFWNKMI